MIATASPLGDLSEAQWQRQVISLAHLHGFAHYHTYRSHKSPTGFPDLVLCGRRVIFAELKRDNEKTSKPTDDQIEWLHRLRQAGAEAYLLRPRHFEAFSTVLGARGPLFSGKAAAALTELVTHFNDTLNARRQAA